MAEFNISNFNTNPECVGQGPSGPASEPFRTAQLVICIIIAIGMSLFAILTLWMRFYRRRLRVRSPLPIFLGSFGGVLVLLIRSAFDFQGREFFPCILEVSIFYSIVPIVILTDTTSAAVFLAKQYQRQLLNANTLQAIESRVQERAHQDERRFATPSEFFNGLSDYLLALFTLTIFVDLDHKYYHHRVRKVSIYRESTYQLITIILVYVPFGIALLVRVLTTPYYRPANGCYGCVVDGTDVAIVCVMLGVLIGPFISLAYKVKTLNIPDPLMLVTDMTRSCLVCAPILVVASILLVTDPGQLMKRQMMDWHFIMFILVWFLHVQRTSFQLHRTRRIHKMGEKHINLIDILSDPRGSLLFEKHLIGELANENLLFWREGIKYKHSFDRNGDFDYSQQMAKVLWRTFLSPHATLPINISDAIKRTMETRFKGIVGKAVFDEALAEVYLMMQNGAFQRFIHSEPYKQYVLNKADFSMSTVLAPMAIVPSVSDGVSQAINIDIKEYIHFI